MKLFKKIIIILLLSILISCYSTPTPIVIRTAPKFDASTDMTIEEYLNKSTTWAVEISAYLQELINQIIHKSRYIDLRDKE